MGNKEREDGKYGRRGWGIWKERMGNMDKKPGKDENRDGEYGRRYRGR